MMPDQNNEVSYTAAAPHKEVTFTKDTLETFTDSLFEAYAGLEEDEISSAETDFMEALKSAQRALDSGAGPQTILLRLVP